MRSVLRSATGLWYRMPTSISCIMLKCISLDNHNLHNSCHPFHSVNGDDVVTDEVSEICLYQISKSGNTINQLFYPKCVSFSIYHFYFPLMSSSFFSIILLEGFIANWCKQYLHNDSFLSKHTL